MQKRSPHAPSHGTSAQPQLGESAVGIAPEKAGVAVGIAPYATDNIQLTASEALKEASVDRLGTKKKREGYFGAAKVRSNPPYFGYMVVLPSCILHVKKLHPFATHRLLRSGRRSLIRRSTARPWRRTQ